MKKRFSYYQISQGQIVAAWYLLFIVKRYNGISAKEAYSIIQSSGKMGGTIPISQGIKICSDYGLIYFNNEKIFFTETAALNILDKCDVEELNVHAQRAILFHILSYHNFEWLILYDTDGAVFRESLIETDREWANLLDNATLFDFTKDDVNYWWKEVLAKYEDYKEKQKKAIGDVGEKLTYNFELERIELDGFKPSKSFVKWASRFSDRFGFDIKSLRGNKLLSKYKIEDKIQIEVKSSDSPNLERFRFFVTKKEWATALENINSYFFYCWAGVNLDKESAQYGPYVIPAKDIQEFIPQDRCDFIQWSESRCILNLRNYS